MEQDNDPLLEVLRFSLKRDITRLYKELLGILTELTNQQDGNIDKLLQIIPAQYHPFLMVVGFCDANRFAGCRKAILDKGNETIREMDKIIDKIQEIVNNKEK